MIRTASLPRSFPIKYRDKQLVTQQVEFSRHLIIVTRIINVLIMFSVQTAAGASGSQVLIQGNQVKTIVRILEGINVYSDYCMGTKSEADLIG